ncbi:MAG: DEAD/DEAH box helicase [Halochromatium sp.]
MSDSSPAPSFADLGLPPALLSALDAVGYETPSPIQAATIPHLLAGSDLLGHAPTGTGKTAAFALPLLARIDLAQRTPQVLVLTPTRELALQVAEACQRYASALGGFHVLPIYGGSDYGGQIRQLKRGVHLVVGTPGRIMDHMRKGTLRLDALQALVLDEADEMLRMGFIDDVEWILEQTPSQRQIALFSATLPSQIQRIAQRHLNDPKSISIEAATATAETIRQRYWLVSGMHKLDALTRILEVEPFDGLLLFVRTKTATTELAARLGARGWAAAALNGDMPQQQREQMVEQLRSGALDILVATDVAARGLDVERISHVVNYDIPYDTEAYIHRIGRTGRAGRAGEAILFVAPRERRMLAAIERATRQRIEPLTLPSTETVNNKRIADFKQRITDTLGAGELGFMQGLIEQYQEEHDVPAVEIAAALAKLSIGDQPLLLTAPERPERSRERPERGRGPRRDDDERPRQQRRPPSSPDQGMERFRIAVGHRNGVKPGNIVGAIANEAGLDARHIGRIDIHEEFSLIDLPTGMPRELLQDLRKVRVCGRALELTRSEAGAAEDAAPGTERRQRSKGPRSGPWDSGPSATDHDRPGRKPAKKNR